MVIHIAFRGGGIGKQPVDPFGIALRAHYFEMLVRRDKADLFPGVALCHYVGIVAYLAKLFADGGDLFVGIFLKMSRRVSCRRQEPAPKRWTSRRGGKCF